MKRPIFIIIGAVLVIILLAVWIYMLFFGSPENDDRFANFGFGDTTDPTFIAPTDSEETPTIDVSSPENPLQQLTTNPVAGYQELDTGTTTPNEVLYAEVGTGHVFSINLDTGEEVRISGTTIAETQAVVFTPNTEFMMVRSGSGFGASHHIGTINRDNESVSIFDLNERVESFSVTNDNRFLYATPESSSLVVKVFNPVSNQTVTLFTIPFREASIDWGNDVDGPHYFYPKASSQLEGYLYSAENGSLNRLSVDGFGFSAIANDTYVIYSEIGPDGRYQSNLHFIPEQESFPLPVAVVPEKCTFAPELESFIMCAATPGAYNQNMPDEWYAGEITSSDTIWRLDGELSGSASSIVDTLRESGRNLDIIDLEIYQDETGVFFKNRYDQTLWTYSRTF